MNLKNIVPLGKLEKGLYPNPIPCGINYMYYREDGNLYLYRSDEKIEINITNVEAYNTQILFKISDVEDLDKINVSDFKSESIINSISSYEYSYPRIEHKYIYILVPVVYNMDAIVINGVESIHLFEMVGYHEHNCLMYYIYRTNTKIDIDVSTSIQVLIRDISTNYEKTLLWKENDEQFKPFQLKIVRATDDIIANIPLSDKQLIFDIVNQHLYVDSITDRVKYIGMSDAQEAKLNGIETNAQVNLPVINNLDSNDVECTLSANMGNVLKNMILDKSYGQVTLGNVSNLLELYDSIDKRENPVKGDRWIVRDQLDPNGNPYYYVYTGNGKYETGNVPSNWSNTGEALINSNIPTNYDLSFKEDKSVILEQGSYNFYNNYRWTRGKVGITSSEGQVDSIIAKENVNTYFKYKGDFLQVRPTTFSIPRKYRINVPIVLPLHTKYRTTVEFHLEGITGLEVCLYKNGVSIVNESKKTLSLGYNLYSFEGLYTTDVTSIDISFDLPSSLNASGTTIRIGRVYVGTDNKGSLDGDNSWKNDFYHSIKPELTFRDEYHNLTHRNNKKYPNRIDARMDVLHANRYPGAVITYQLTNDLWVTERYNGDSPNADVWPLETNWTSMANGYKLDYLSLELLKGQTFSILGDSISTFRGSIPPENENGGGYPLFDVTSGTQMWFGDLIQKFGMRLLVNNSMSGSTVSEIRYLERRCLYNRVEELSKDGEIPDNIYIFAGTNDYGRQLEIGDYNFKTKINMRYFRHSIYALFEKTRRLYPRSKVRYILPIQRAVDSPYSNDRINLVEYIDVIREMASVYGIQCIDAHMAEINHISGEPSYNLLPDGLHPNKAGNTILREAVNKNLVNPSSNSVSNFNNNKDIEFAFNYINDLEETNKGIHNHFREIFNSNAIPVISVVTYNGDDYAIFARNPLILAIKRGKYQITEIELPMWISRIASSIKGDELHIITTESIPHIPTKNRHYVFNFKTKTIIEKSIIDTGRDLMACWSTINFKGNIYACLSYEGSYQGEGMSSKFIYENCRVELYKFNDVDWEKVSTISDINDIWGYEYMDGTNLRKSVPNTAWWRSLISTDGEYLYCTNPSILRNILVNHIIFTKKSKDGINWTNDEILSPIRANYASIIHYKGVKMYIAKQYTDNTFNYEISDISICINDMYNTSIIGLTDYISDLGKEKNSRFNFFDNGDSVTIIISYTYEDGRNNSALDIFSIKKQDIYDRFMGFFKKDRGVMTEEPFDFKIGDSYIYNKRGKSDIVKWKYPYIYSVRELKVDIGKNEQVRIINNGSKVSKTVIPIFPKMDRVDSFVFETRIQFNKFISPYFRIPCITLSSDSESMYATCDIRYTTGGDKDIIQVGFAKSSDNGLTWGDYKVILFRDENANFLNRIHDCSLLVDTNKLSSTYGNIHAFAKQINTELPEEQWVDAGYMKFMHTYSKDGGITWSKQEELTGLFPSDAFHISTGAQAGITMRNGTLIQPIYFTRFENGVKTQRGSFIYSKDGGVTWQAGDITPGYGGENKIIQLSNGDLLMNSRDAFSTGWATRKIYTLSSIGSGWISRPEYQTITTVNCNESLALCQGVYVYSQPTGYRNGTGRSDISVFKSRDLIHWEEIKQLTTGVSNGYSSIIFNDNTLGVFYEAVGGDLVYSSLDYIIPLL